MLHSLVSAPHEERFVVIHTEEKKGFVITASGVADNHQFHTILMSVLCTLPEADRLQGKPIDPSVHETMTRSDRPQSLPEHIHGEWDMSHWTIRLLPQGTLFDLSNMDRTSIWGEGVPNDINKFRGERIILLQPPLYDRTWSCVRVFAPLRASVNVEHIMTPGEVQKYLDDFSTATEEEKKKAIDEVLYTVNKTADP